ncbi:MULTISPECIES: 1,4-dihydroxy-2-naphthoate polyprenyltransferase [Aeromicrobium]|uniref:1,4-dihydroxy-2-naphthoate polyprenyltransferase n=1 Tax=Aeromicrobium TaxID=2040 RepID=UPI0006F81960|nr:MULTISPECIES: 1,4-dihydroxy-2-naphthoate polyprenyltransferase [Aeromicrobium]KQX74684.1 1,4-dihydroxy-2-naphthoate octaprenyltransferase [Aeromicrobium sp. Root472D3]MBD8607381.1 1,4-dihydroxy-2-naphthoate polyprenyltransferase [Aeromicrobium sp. CFBP 8757]MCL8252682.1 1,4-dihydroxy-2-naphthoate polyprenyltransferase [Aeromicrobium fastidiosum]
MTTSSPSPVQLWVAGSRPRTLPAAVAPVLAGTGAAAYADSVVWWKALLALGVSLALQIGVNYANDYSDGIKGTDDDRVGPLRLVGSGLVPARSVKIAALGFLGLGAAMGLVLAATTTWWLLLVGVAALGAAWTYTGGPSPYGYRALGEVSVFVFFGLVAVLGTAYVQVEEVTGVAVAAAVGVGALACGILVANNLRDIPTDSVTGKRTLAVVLGDSGTRRLYGLLGFVALAMLVWAAFSTPWALLGLLCLPLLGRGAATVASGARGMALIPVLRDTGLAELVYAAGLAIGLAIGA